MYFGVYTDNCKGKENNKSKKEDDTDVREKAKGGKTTRDRR